MSTRRVIMSAKSSGSTRMTLSDRFSAIRAVAQANRGTTGRANEAAERGGERRAGALNAKRGGGGAAPGGKAGEKKTNNKGGAAAPGAKGGAAGGKKGGKKGGAKAPKPVTKDDLDAQLAQYKHEAGQGPDPKAEKMDKELAAYFA